MKGKTTNERFAVKEDVRATLFGISQKSAILKCHDFCCINEIETQRALIDKHKLDDDEMNLIHEE